MLKLNDRFELPDIEPASIAPPPAKKRTARKPKAVPVPLPTQNTPHAQRGTNRDRAGIKAARLNALLVRWGRIHTEIGRLLDDTPDRFFELFADSSEEIKTGRVAISDVMASIGIEYGVVASRAG